VASIDPVHIRRALLLFAIVLALAALVTSVSQPTKNTRKDPPPPPSQAEGTPEASGRPAPRSGKVVRVLERPGKPRPVRLAAGQAATLEVTVRRPGIVEVPGLGLSASADPGTPAALSVLVRRPRRLDVLFMPAGSNERRPIGTVVVR